MKVSERTYQVIIGVLVLVILLGGGWTLGNNMRLAKMTASTNDVMLDAPKTVEDTATAVTPSNSVPKEAVKTPSVAADGEEITVNAQPAGMGVSVASVSFGKAGWVAVRDSNGKTLGAAWFPAGTQKNVSVSLLRATEAGKRYQAMLYIDDGDKQFDLHKDTLVTNADGSVGGTLFDAR